MFDREKYLIKKAINDAGLPFGNYFIAGGACTSIFSNTKINDLDVYCRDIDSFCKMSNFFSKVDGDGNYVNHLLAETLNADTYKCKNTTVQLIKKYFLPPEQLIEKFDFTICMCAYDVQADEFVMGKDFIYDLSKRSLRFTGKTEYPIASLCRMKKFLKRDFNVSAVDMIAIALSINNLHMGTFKDLKEQLEGIDTSLLSDLTDAFMDRKDARYEMTEVLSLMDEKLTQKYMNEVVDTKGVN